MACNVPLSIEGTFLHSFFFFFHKYKCAVIRTRQGLSPVIYLLVKFTVHYFFFRPILPFPMFYCHSYSTTLSKKRGKNGFEQRRRPPRPRRGFWDIIVTARSWERIRKWNSLEMWWLVADWSAMHINRSNNEREPWKLFLSPYRFLSATRRSYLSHPICWPLSLSLSLDLPPRGTPVGARKWKYKETLRSSIFYDWIVGVSLREKTC